MDGFPGDTEIGLTFFFLLSCCIPKATSSSGKKLFYDLCLGCLGIGLSFCGNYCNEWKNTVTLSIFLLGNIPKYSENDFIKIVRVYNSPLLLDV